MIEIKSASATGVFRSSVTDIFLDIEYIELGFGTRQYTPQKTATFTYTSTFENIFFWLEILTVQSRSVGD